MPTKDEIHNFLIDLRDSGVTNMFGASPYLMEEFGMTRYEAKDADRKSTRLNSSH